MVALLQDATQWLRETGVQHRTTLVTQDESVTIVEVKRPTDQPKEESSAHDNEEANEIVFTRFWFEYEKERFFELKQLYKKDWCKIAEVMQTKTPKQVRYF